MNLSKRVIILDKLNSPLIAQAIFILKDEPRCEFSAVEEAERIVSDYMSGHFSKKPSSRKKKYILAFIASILLVAVFTFLKK